MVECLVWDQDAAGSSPVTSTKKGGFQAAFFLLPKLLKMPENMRENGLNTGFFTLCKVHLSQLLSFEISWLFYCSKKVNLDGRCQKIKVVNIVETWIWKIA